MYKIGVLRYYYYLQMLTLKKNTDLKYPQKVDGEESIDKDLLQFSLLNSFKKACSVFAIE